ncbi:MAG: hypothetical protein KC912_09090 [Proteobacteria bacterium]|nr:hypothetical protein [Pseudomonadota bacterium]
MRALIPLIPLIAIASACTPPDDSAVATFDHVWEEFDGMYGGFDIRGVDWDAEYDTWRPTLDEQSTDDDLWETLTGMLAVFDDGHIGMSAPGREYFNGNHVIRDKPDDDAFDIEVVKSEYLTDVEIGPWDGYVLGELEPGLPYVWFPWVDDNTYVLEEIEERYPDARALVIDLRHNGGGSFTYPYWALGMWTGQDLDIHQSRTRSGPERGEFDDWFTWPIQSRTDDPIDLPIVLLTDSYTISAGERMVLGLQALPNTTTIGVRTNGALATSIGREMPNGWFFNLPTQEIRRMDGEIFEAVGCAVDIELLNDPEVLAAGTDEMLEAAMAAAP